MSTDVKSQIEIIRRSKEIWTNIANKQTEPGNLFGLNVSTNDISFAFEKVISLLNFINENDIDRISYLRLNNTSNAIERRANEINSQVVKLSNNPNNKDFIKSICINLLLLKNELIPLIPIHYEYAKLSPDFIHYMKAEIIEAQKRLQELEKIKMNVEEIKNNALSSFSAIENQKNESENIAKTFQDLQVKIEGYEREASTAKTNTDSSASTAKVNAESVSELVKELKASVETKEKLFKEFENRRDETIGYLKNANKVGLAKSFEDKRSKAFTMLLSWAGIFTIGIIILFCLGLFILFPLSQKSTDPMVIVSDFILTAPFIWLTWFAALQYGNSLRIYEDYTFKASTAMAFVGYRDEMGTDPKMLQLLQEAAIQNFSANPIRLVLKKADPASPIHDGIEKSLGKVDWEKLKNFFDFFKK